MDQIFGLICMFGSVSFFLIIGLVIGGINEKNHLKSLEERETQLRHIRVTQIKSFPGIADGGPPPTMLVAEVVISSDYLKTFVAGFRNFIGGEVRSFQTIIERSRRESVIRLQEEAAQRGYNAICNVRIETADLAGRGANQKNKIFASAILATATAYTAQDAGKPA